MIRVFRLICLLAFSLNPRLSMVTNQTFTERTTYVNPRTDSKSICIYKDTEASFSARLDTCIIYDHVSWCWYFQLNIPSSYKYQAVSNMYGSVLDVLRTDLPMKYADSAFAGAFHQFIRSQRNANFLIEICFQTSPS